MVGKHWANNTAWFVGIRDMTGAEMCSDFDDDTERRDKELARREDHLKRAGVRGF